MQYYSVGPYAIIKKSQLSKEDLLFFQCIPTIMHKNCSYQMCSVHEKLLLRLPFFFFFFYTELNPNASLVTVAH